MDGTSSSQPPGFAPAQILGRPSPVAPPMQSFGEAFGGPPTNAVPAAPATTAVQGHGRFAPLSALPPDKRLPPRRGSAPVPGAPPPQAPTHIAPREVPGQAHPNPSRQLSKIKQIGFNCPSCLAILIIKQPENYDGQAAPCPNCNVVILPPRIAPATPFSLLGPPTPSAPYPPPAAMPQPPAHIPMGLPAPASSKPGLPGARKLAQAAMF
jgi:hypothetical protein